MNHGTSLILTAALLLATAPSEAGSRRASSGGGELASDRGVSRVEDLAITAVLKETAGASPATGDQAAPEPRRRNYSADYYRAYSWRTQMQVGARKVAVKPASTPPPAPAKTAALKPQKPVGIAPNPRTAFAKPPKVAAVAPISRSAPAKPQKVAALAPMPRTAFAQPPIVTEVKPIPRQRAGEPVNRRVTMLAPLRVAVAPKPAARLPTQPVGTATPVPTRGVFRN